MKNNKISKAKQFYKYNQDDVGKIWYINDNNYLLIIYYFC